MGWKDWDRTNKVVVSACAIVVIAAIVIFAVVMTRPKATEPLGPPSAPRSETSASPTPTYQCTTATGPDCTKDLAEKEAARDKAYKDSEAALRTYYAELIKARKAGGAEKSLPPKLADLVAKEFESDVLQGLKKIYVQKIYYKGEAILSKISPTIDSDEWPTNSVNLNMCVDSRRLLAVRRTTNTAVRQGDLVQGTASMKVENGKWVVANINAKVTAKC